MGIWQTIVNFISTMKFATIIWSYEQGVRFRFGHIKSTLGPGLHWQWPFVDTIEVVDCRVTAVDLPHQSVWTEGKQCLTVSGIVLYHIVNPVRAITVPEELESNLQAETMYALHNALSACSAEEAHDTDSIEEEVIELTKVTFRRWGIKADRIGLTDGPNPVRLIRLLGEPEIL